MAARTAAREAATLDPMAGRAKVRDDDRLRAFYRELEAHEAGALWTVLNALEPDHPTSTSRPMKWAWDDLRPKVMKATELVTAEDAARRVIMLVNPDRKRERATCGWLFSGLQVMLPGEALSAHEHTFSALRFVLEGEGGYTVVDGEILHVRPKDFLLTPSGSWHDHGVRPESDTPVVWQDGLDIPLVHALECPFYRVHPELRQTPTTPVNASHAMYGTGGMIPADTRWDRPYSPLAYYPWARSEEALRNLARVSDGSPYDGVIMDFVNPVTGGPVMPTIGVQMQMLRPGEHTRAHRHTGTVIYTVAEVCGRSVIDGRRFDWKENDVFCVPSWSLHEHANGSGTDEAFLFSFNDSPMMRSLALWREEVLEENGGRQEAAAGEVV